MRDRKLEDDLATIRFDVFKTAADRKLWSKHLEYAQRRIDISEEERVSLIESLQFLEKELGASFFKNTRGSNPIEQRITGFKEEIIEFANKLKRIKDSGSNLSYLIKEKLIPNKACWREGRHFFDISSYFIEAGFNVNFLEERPPFRMPDLEIINPINDDSFYVEVTTMNEDMKRLNKRMIQNFLWRNCFDVPPRIPYSCKVIKDISDNDLLELQGVIIDLKREAIEKESLVKFSDGNIQIAMTNQSNIKELELWAKDNNDNKLEITGLSFQYIDTHRIANNKIKRKADQIPSDKNGMLYIHVEPLYLMTSNPIEIIESFQQRMKGLKNLLGITLYTSLGNKVKDIFAKEEGNFYSNKMMNERLSRELLFIYNNDCKTVLAQGTIDKIYKSFN